MGLKKGLFTNGCKKNKTCSNCSKKNTRKRGTHRGIIRYFCNDCETSFSSKRRPINFPEIIFKKYVYKRQFFRDITVNEILIWKYVDAI